MTSAGLNSLRQKLILTDTDISEKLDFWWSIPQKGPGIFHLGAKGQLILKANCQAEDFSKKRTNEFVFNTMSPVFIRFLEEIEDSKKAFWNYLTFSW